MEELGVGKEIDTLGLSDGGGLKTDSKAWSWSKFQLFQNMSVVELMDKRWFVDKVLLPRRGSM
eukprot:454281-Ditylum_brightwellii.AAC.1